MDFDTLKQLLHNKYSDLEIKEMNPSDFIFEQRVSQKCYHCKNYNVKWTCPPKTPAVNYPILFSEYKHATLLVCKMDVNSVNFQEKRAQSTNNIHKALLYLEKEMYYANHSLAISFIGGSCKLCKNGCNENRCVNPELSRMPLEATGCNVVESLKKVDINVTFPITDTLYRYGLLLW